MISSQSLPALLFIFGLFFVDESPRWLIRKNRLQRAGQILTKIGGSGYAAVQTAIIKDSFGREIRESRKDLFSKKYRNILILGIAIAVFSQADGQNSLFS